MAEPDAFPTPPPLGTAARAAALACLADHRAVPTSLVGYQSSGRVAVLGPETRAIEIAQALPAALTGTVIAVAENAEPTAPDEAGGGGGFPRFIRARVEAVEGYLGAFRIIGSGGTVVAPSPLSAGQPFDLVLDLNDSPLIASEIPPPGYYHAGEEEDIERSLAALPSMVGEFEKPRFFRYDSDLCVHGSRGITACTRCIDACPADAIQSLGERVEVDPYLCQGGGVCATVCPSGAMRYAYPSAEDLLERLRAALVAYRGAGGEDPIVLLHDRETGRVWVEAQEAALPYQVIPCEIEEVASVGADGWLALLAYGARGVWILRSSAVSASVQAAVDEQMALAHTLLVGLGYSASCIAWHDGASVPDAIESGCRHVPSASFAPIDEKRTLIGHAIEHLARYAPAPAESVALPAGSPFGTLKIDTETCTLCMACPSVCPARALEPGGDVPELRFIEWNCVQCGLCEQACPEGSIRRVPRFLFEARARLEVRVLNEDRVFRCIHCGKPFATEKIIERMTGKLAAHWMFQKPEAMRRLQMCEDCRVKDVFKDGGGLLRPGAGSDERQV